MRSGMKMLMAANRGNETRGNRGYEAPESRRDYGESNYTRMEYGGTQANYGPRNEQERTEPSRMRRGGYETRSNYGGENSRSNYTRNEYESEMGDMVNRFRDRWGREHYDNGRFAPVRNRMDEDEMEDMEPENRRRFPRRRDGTFAPRSEMQDSDGDMHYPMYPAPIYEHWQENPQMNRIGFEAEHQRGNVVPMTRNRSTKLTREMAEEWMGGLRNEDGSTGPKWSMEDAKRIMKQKGIEVDPLTFWVAMNALYSDYCNVLKKHNASTIDMYADLACAWIKDEDAVKDKASVYYSEVVKK